MVGGIITPHWSVTARLKLGSPQPARCWPPPFAYFDGCLEPRGMSDEQTVNLAPGKCQRVKKQPILWLTSKLECQDHVSWPLQRSTSQVDDSRKIAIINRELKQLNIDIAALEEIRLQSNNSLREQDYTFFCQGKLTTTLGLAAFATLVSAGWMRMGRGCWNYALTTTSA